ncbi:MULTISPECIES: O-antigen translocase [Pseudomonas]|uniref:O-antigen translocase n=1 Tax=Pseudomonas quercus TaxID=2722792 RepID=A0ABX0YJ54_9PSED|nr:MULTISPECIES: O-antigen translocase [Pseudomonas]MBF7143758.1 O-antigen translocase [Pseudomonas sp. LY10J]NJP02364.1 O-antigen translocase [Pseudomonas quercus]
MNLIKTSLLNGIAVAVKMVTLLGLNKILAIYIGPAGFAAIGQFQNALQMITTFTGGAITNGVVKYTAEYGDDENLQRGVWKVAGTLTVLGSLLTAVLLAIFSRELSGFFLHDESVYDIFLWLAGGVVFFSLNTLLLAILNGKKEILLYVGANIAGSLLSLLITVGLTMLYGLHGALISLVLYQSISFFVTATFCVRTQWFRLTFLFGSLEGSVIKKLSAFFFMALVAAVATPIVQTLIRRHLGADFGWEVAGYWDAITRLSGAYLLIVTTTLSVYYLPKLSELKTGKEIRSEILQGYKFILPVAMFAGLMMYLLRDFIILVLFTDAFSPMRMLFAGQVVGDSLKIVSWIIAYVMLSKAMVKEFVIAEVASCLCLYGLTVVFTDRWGIVAVTWAYAATYLVYGLMMYFLVYEKLHTLDQKLGSDVI